MKKYIKNKLKGSIFRHKRVHKMFLIYKSNGVNSVIFACLVFVLIKLHINVNKYLKKEAILLHRDSKHLNILEKLLIQKKRIKATIKASEGKVLLKKGFLPLEKI